MDPNAYILNALEGWLRSPLILHDVRRSKYPITGLEFISTHRFLLVLKGRLSYTVNETTTTIEAGSQIFVPAWVWRESRPGPGPACDCIWCEFSSDSVEFDASCLFMHKCYDPAVELAALKRMMELWPGSRILADYHERHATPLQLSRLVHVQLEGELKAMLARFWSKAEPCTQNKLLKSAPIAPLHGEVRKALRWLGEHYTEPAALEHLYKNLQLSPNHFRLLFHRVLRCSPRDYLVSMRMRRARLLVMESGKSLKEIAFIVGFSDPAFFSRQYHHCFGVSPRADRRRVEG